MNGYIGIYIVSLPVSYILNKPTVQELYTGIGYYIGNITLKYSRYSPVCIM